MRAITLRRVAVAVVLAAAVVGLTVTLSRSECRWGTFAYTIFTGDPASQEDWRRDAAVLVNGEERIVTEDKSAWDIGLSPEGDRIVVAKAVGGTQSEYDSPEMIGLFIYDLDGSNEVELEAIGTHPNWSPDGEQIAFMTDRRVKVVAVDDKEERRVFRLSPSDAVDPPYLNDIAWSADSSRIAVAVGHKTGTTIWTMDVDGSDRTRAMRIDDNLIHDLEWSPDGAFAWSGHYEGVFSVVVAEPSGELMQVEPHSEAPSWSRDGSQLAYVIGWEAHYGPRIVVGDARGQDEEPIPFPDDARGEGSLEDWASC